MITLKKTRFSRTRWTWKSTRLADSETWPRYSVLPLSFISLLDPLIQRLQYSRIYGGDHVYRGVQLFFGHPCFPCVRKAPIHSWIAQPHHRDGESDEHLLALGEAFDGMGVSVKSSKIGFLHGYSLSQTEGAACCAPTSFLRGFDAGDQRIGKCALHVRVIAVRMPGEIILLHAVGEFRIFLLNFQGRFEPVPSRGDAIHPFLVK